MASDLRWSTGMLKKTLNLIGVKIHRHHAVGACSLQQISHEARRDGHSWLVLSILPCIAEVWYDCGDIAGRGTFGRVHHQEQLHEIVGGRKCALHEEDPSATNTFVDNDAHFSVAKSAHRHVAESFAVVKDDLGG